MQRANLHKNHYQIEKITPSRGGCRLSTGRGGGVKISLVVVVVVVVVVQEYRRLWML